MKIFAFGLSFAIVFCLAYLLYLFAFVQTLKPELMKRILWPTQHMLNSCCCLEVGNLSFQAGLAPNCPHIVRSAKAIMTMGQKVKPIQFM